MLDRNKKLKMKLANKQCTLVKRGDACLTRDEIDIMLQYVPEWELMKKSIHMIKRSLKFLNFSQTFSFVHDVAQMSLVQEHYPNISFGNGHVTIILYSTIVKGLHKNDFILAAKIDEIVQ